MIVDSSQNRMSLEESLEVFEDAWVATLIERYDLLNYQTEGIYQENSDQCVGYLINYGVANQTYSNDQLKKGILELIKDFNEEEDNHDLVNFTPEVEISDQPSQELKEYLEHFHCEKMPFLREIHVRLLTQSS